MDATESSVSPAVEAAWRIAARGAGSSGSIIDPAHMLHGIFSLDKLISSDSFIERRAEIQAEVSGLENVLNDSGLTLQAIRRSIRSILTPTSKTLHSESATDQVGALSRSIPCREAFEEAALEPIDFGRARVRLIPLTRCLLERLANAPEVLGIGDSKVNELLIALKEAPGASKPVDDSAIYDFGEMISVFSSLDAEAIDDKGVNWAKIGEHFASLCEMSWAAGTSLSIESLFDGSIQRLLKAIPSAQQAAVLIQDHRGNLLLKAHFPKGVLPVSSSSARKAIDQREGFIWQRGEDLSSSQRASNLRAGIYAPLLASGEVFGVICLDTTTTASRFTSEDLFLVTSLGHQLGLMLANRSLQETLRDNSRVLERLLTNFSPQVRSRLLQKAEAGRLKLGGERSVISILCSDIRGFTLMTKDMDAEEVVSMLNDYFSALVSAIFRHGGTVDKFIGDAILAVFGSPEADPAHTEKSLRAALDMQAEMKRISNLRSGAGLPFCEIGIGVHTGEVIHGFIGSAERMEFTVIGSAVNLASRFCAAAKGGQILISSQVLEREWRNAVVEAVDIQTKHEGALEAYRLLDVRSSA